MIRFSIEISQTGYLYSLVIFLKIGLQNLQRALGQVPLDDEHGGDAVLFIAVCSASVDGLDQEHCWSMVLLFPI